VKCQPSVRINGAQRLGAVPRDVVTLSNKVGQAAGSSWTS
jgi:hypothetical protein